jgi:chromosomal replication initiator protein
MESELRKPSFDTWLRGTRPVAFTEDTLVIGVPNAFALEWIETRYLSLIRTAVKQIVGEGVGVRLVIPPEAGETAAAVDTLPPLAADSQQPDGSVLPPSLNPKYTFESFVIGEGNRLAHAGSMAVAENPGRAYNPLFLYGGVGLGKTHLMQAIGHQVSRNQPGKMAILYVTSETFTNGLINAIRDDRTIEFKNRYRNIDILLIDDIQFLAGKERTQEEFFHTFEALHGAGRQVVITSDRPPKDIPTLEERLRSRFEWGLLADIQPPDLETRAAILRKKAQYEALVVPDDVLMHIAGRINTNIRELEGALIRIVALASLENRAITLDLATEALHDILPSRASRPITLAEIQRSVARRYAVTVEDLKADSRVRRLAFPRQVAMYLCREMTSHSLPKIGEEFGGRDHTTVMHACEKIGRERRTEPELAETLRLLVSELQTRTVS